MRIYIKNYSESDEHLLLMKQVRNDIFVEIEDRIFNLHFIGYRRFFEEAEDCVKRDGYYAIEPNTIITDSSVSKENVVLQCNRLGEGAINCMVPCHKSDDIIFLNLSEVEKNEYLKAGWEIAFDKKVLMQIY